MRRISEIIIHCSATKAGQNFKAANIDIWHREAGFAKIGYHFVIDIDGQIELGRSIAEVGAHTSGHNNYSIGVCYIGGLDKNGNPCDTRTEAQNESFKILLTTLHRMFPLATLHGHKDFAKKACPCFDVSDYGFIFNK